MRESQITPAVERLAAIIQIPTVSRQSGREPEVMEDGSDPFDRLLETMAAQWPLVHGLENHRMGHHGLLIRWPGAGGSRPVVLMAHLDVVPVVEEEWSHPPFSAAIVDGEMWGRGTLDDKGCVAGICESVESLLGEGFQPSSDVWLSFGCDEETHGTAAQAAVAFLTEQGVRPWIVVDEGGAIAHEALPGVAAPVGVVGVTEKGTTSLTLTVTDDGGHASTPMPGGPAARLAKALVAVDGVKMPRRMHPVTAELFKRVAPALPRPIGMAAGQLGRLGPISARALTLAGPEAAAMVRTTVALTTLEGSKAINVLPSSVRAGINLRVMVGDTVAGVVDRLRRAIDDDSVRIDLVDANEPSPVSPWDGDPGFALVEQTIAEIYPDAIPAPYVMLAATDSRFFTAIAERVYRFGPFRMSRAQRVSIHGADERIGIEHYLDGVRWYRLFLENLTAAEAAR